MAKRLTWDEHYSLLKEYYQEHGNINMAIKYQVNNVNLGNWLNMQRRAYRSQGKWKITEEQIEKLNELGMIWEIQKDNWEENYKLLVEYYNEHGNIDIKTRYIVNGVKLGLWLNTQRNAYKGKGAWKITKERIDKLNKLGMKWDFQNDKWEDNYRLLVEYYNEHGNINVPQKYVVKKVKLGVWLDNQRKLRDKLTEEQIEKLNKLGIKWNLRKDQWEENYELFKKYRKEHGNTDIVFGYKVNDVNLGNWVATQCQAYKGHSTTKITDEHIVLLNKEEIDWSKNDTKKLNSNIKDMNKYKHVMLNRMKNILRDLILEEINEINSTEAQDEIEKTIIKRMWR